MGFAANFQPDLGFGQRPLAKSNFEMAAFQQDKKNRSKHVDEANVFVNMALPCKDKEWRYKRA
jgi:hypothetical protein